MPKQLRGRLLDGRCDLGEDNRQGGESSGMVLDWRRGCELGTGGATGKGADRGGQHGGEEPQVGRDPSRKPSVRPGAPMFPYAGKLDSSERKASQSGGLDEKGLVMANTTADGREVTVNSADYDGQAGESR